MKCNCSPTSQYEFEQDNKRHKVCMDCGLHYVMWQEGNVRKGTKSYIPTQQLRDMDASDPERRNMSIMEMKWLKKIHNPND